MNWHNMQDQSFYDATARQRARYLLDDGTFHELAGPEQQQTSPHLPVLGEAVAFDDGVVLAAGRIGQRPVLIISQEGRFIGGSVGEVGGAKMVAAFKLALNLHAKATAKYPGDDQRKPAVIISFETGGVRLHEANAGLLAHSEIMEQIQACRGKVPVISLVGSKLGCFGGMGFVAVATDMLIMSDMGRVGLTGPEVIEEVMGKKAFNAADRALIYRMTGGKHRYLMGECTYLVQDSIGDFRNQLCQVLQMSPAEIASHRSIGSQALVNQQLAHTALAAQLKPEDPRDIWAYLGNPDPDELPDMDTHSFTQTAKRLRSTHNT